MKKTKNTTLIAINNDYIKWIENQGFVEKDAFTLEEITEYINDVLIAHRASWDELKEN